ncbi:biotin transporter BioY [Arsenicitalea aurantiaca]|uniref:Biotin transporter n=1 Tax=Arsenicitalea aurantiaca TaxID=1783274 RepID=A0A433XAK0_9HYPH|nr:biotin transporter BioY [Arsenicitalea aurantiaca]RUT31106.1 biotin transporter BioY [Arsenicitalea aurantiaca]
MATSLTTPKTLLGAVQSRTEGARLATSVASVLLGTLVLAAAARFNIPMLPVPVTLQTMAVAMIAAGLGARLATATVVLYILQGLAGLPVFAGGGGAAYVFSPTFGFILGWVPMAFLIGLAADRGLSQKIVPLFAVMVGANALAFGTGYLWLVAMSGGAAWIDQSNVLGSAFAVAVQPFIVWDLLKMAFAAISVAGLWAALRRKA